MGNSLINYQIYIIMGICIFLIIIFIIYFVKKLIDRKKYIHTLHNIKSPLKDIIHIIEDNYELKKEKEEINTIIQQIKHDIYILKQNIYTSQNSFKPEKIDKIKQEINDFYDIIQGPKNINQIEPKYINKQEGEQILSSKTYNEYISKFLIVYREKDKIIEEKNKFINEKNKSIYILQQKLTEAENKLKNYINQEKNNHNKDKIIEEKIYIINTLKQRLQDVENKFKKIALLHKSITEKEQIKDQIIEEKNQFIIGLQNKLTEIEKKLQHMSAINEDNREKNINKKIYDIEKKIQIEKRKIRILITLFIFLLILSILGAIFIYNNYIPKLPSYTI